MKRLVAFAICLFANPALAETLHLTMYATEKSAASCIRSQAKNIRVEESRLRYGMPGYWEDIKIDSNGDFSAQVQNKVGGGSATFNVKGNTKEHIVSESSSDGMCTWVGKW